MGPTQQAFLRPREKNFIFISRGHTKKTQFLKAKISSEKNLSVFTIFEKGKKKKESESKPEYLGEMDKRKTKRKKENNRGEWKGGGGQLVLTCCRARGGGGR